MHQISGFGDRDRAYEFYLDFIFFAKSKGKGEEHSAGIFDACWYLYLLWRRVLTCSKRLSFWPAGAIFFFSYSGIEEEDDEWDDRVN